MERLIDAVAKGKIPSRGELAALLALQGDPAEKLHRAAGNLKRRILGGKVFRRGLIEFSNVCRCDCLYCGIRKSNPALPRYTLTDDEILAAARFAAGCGYGAVVLQSGERRDDEFVRRVGHLVREIKKIVPSPGITLSCGEQSADVYRAWRDAGAERYLLRIETTDEALFRALHDGETRFEARVRALDDLRDAGFTVGSGVMIGLPGQSVDSLAGDLEFFRKKDFDMIGMGPYLPQSDTPLGRAFADTPEKRRRRLELSLNMISLARLTLRDVNIAATTALQAIDPENGRLQGILCGANVIMPAVAEAARRQSYRLYDDKPSTDEASESAREKLNASLRAVGGEPAYGDSGTPLHYLRRVQNKQN
ncbi:MAG: [FeFe] hydrogenase H-cluster radical SAM maturase HydE [Victivallaceae bacterium]|nr:[FeFe] hydrogenase H-cluster radical SAM maturase HydE [Victivallaceae bacterium]